MVGKDARTCQHQNFLKYSQGNLLFYIFLVLQCKNVEGNDFYVKAINFREVIPVKKTFLINGDYVVAGTNGKLIETGKTILSQATSINDATKAWNLAPEEVQKSITYNVAKKVKLLLKLYQF